MIDKIKKWAESPEGKEFLKTTAYVSGGSLTGVVLNNLFGKDGLKYDVAAGVAGGLGGYGLKWLDDKNLSTQIKRDNEEQQVKELKKIITPQANDSKNKDNTTKKQKSEEDIAREQGYYINRDKNGGILNYSKITKPSLIQKIVAFITARRTMTDEQLEKSKELLDKNSSDPASELERIQADVNYNQAQQDAAKALSPLYWHTGIGSGIGLTTGLTADFFRNKSKVGSAPFPKAFKAFKNGATVNNTADLQNVLRATINEATPENITQIKQQIITNNTPKYRKMSKPIQNVLSQLEAVEQSKPVTLTPDKLIQVNPAKGIDASSRQILANALGKGARTISTEPGVLLPNSKVNMFKQMFYNAPSKFKALKWLWPTLTGVGAITGVAESAKNFDDATQRLIEADRQRKELSNFLGK